MIASAEVIMSASLFYVLFVNLIVYHYHSIVNISYNIEVQWSLFI